MNKSHHELLRLLADGRFHSGTELGESLSVSRTAIWQKIRQLEKYGLVIDSVKGKGHRLSSSLELLDQDRICAGLPDSVRSELAEINVYSELDSTNRYLLELLGSEEIHSHLVFAEYQTAGRGRRGNPWISPFASGICFSLGWHFPVSPEPLTVIALGTGVAIVRALNKLGITGVGLKWPNDIFINDRKLGGILVEMRAESTGPCNVVIGVGLNYEMRNSGTDLIDQPWVDINTITTTRLSRNDCVSGVINELINMLNEISRSDPGYIINEWRKYDCLKGRFASLILPGDTVNGRILGIDDHGALVMEIDHQVKKYNVGEISVRAQ